MKNTDTQDIMSSIIKAIEEGLGEILDIDGAKLKIFEFVDEADESDESDEQTKNKSTKFKNHCKSNHKQHNCHKNFHKCHKNKQDDQRFRNTLIEEVENHYINLCSYDFKLLDDAFKSYEEGIESMEEVIFNGFVAALAGVNIAFEAPEILADYLLKEKLEIDKNDFVTKVKGFLVFRDEILDSVFNIYEEFVEDGEIKINKENLKDLEHAIRVLVNYSNTLIIPLIDSLLSTNKDLEEPKIIAEKFYNAMASLAADELRKIKDDDSEDISEELEKIVDDIIANAKHEKANKANEVAKNENPIEQLVYSDEKIEIIYDFSIPKFKIRSNIPADFIFDPNYQPEFPKSKEIRKDLDV